MFQASHSSALQRQSSAVRETCWLTLYAACRGTVNEPDDVTTTDRGHCGGGGQHTFPRSSSWLRWFGVPHKTKHAHFLSNGREVTLLWRASLSVGNLQLTGRSASVTGHSASHRLPSHDDRPPGLSDRYPCLADWSPGLFDWLTGLPP